MRRAGERRPGFRPAGVVAVLLATATAVVLAPAASADAAPAARRVITTQAPVVPTTTISTQVQSTVSRGAWSCTLTVDTPTRFWGGSGGGVFGSGHLNCTHVMPQMEIVVGLMRNGTFMNVQSDYDTSTIQVNTVASTSPYSAATYQVAALGAVEWPDATITQIPQLNGPAMQL